MFLNKKSTRTENDRLMLWRSHNFLVQMNFTCLRYK
jgi:hypothetical protein